MAAYADFREIATATWRERLSLKGISLGRGDAMTAVVLYPY
jgi:hypothetical protein